MNLQGGSMKTSSILFLCALHFVLGTVTPSLAQTREDKFVGSEPVINSRIWESMKEPTPAQQQIARILRIASKMQYVNDVMAVKESGLIYVTNLADLDYLSTFTVSNPSDGYRMATGDFIARHVGTYIRTRADIPALMKLTGRVETVPQAMACKWAGLKVATTAATFLQILPFAVASPSEAYQTMVGAFVAQNISRVLGPKSSIKVILKIESYSVLVSEAMAVKNAGLVAVKTKEDLLSLADFAFESPSSAYQEAIREFIRNNISRFP